MRIDLNEHDLRRQVVEEMHLRRWPAIQAPSTVVQILRLIERQDEAREFEVLGAIANEGQVEHAVSRKHLSARLSSAVSVTWERHKEASATTLFVSGVAALDLAQLNQDGAIAKALAWLETAPGATIRATHLCITNDDKAAGGLLEQANLYPSDLVSCHLDGGARLWSDFRIGPEGLGKVLIAANGLTTNDLSRVTQKLQELGNYRNLALLGFPLAKDNWDLLDAIEQQLTRLAMDMHRADITDDMLLERVSALSLELMTISTGTDYRMSATAAYAQLADERLRDLQVIPIQGFPSLVDFTHRRLLPAVRTCTTHQRRTRELTNSAAHFAALLRTRIETRIENQNGRLLASMDRSAARQLRLQELVESLSVVVLSYYCIGLFHYVLEGIELPAAGLHEKTLTALLVPIVIGTLWVIIKRRKKHLLSEKP